MSLHCTPKCFFDKIFQRLLRKIDGYLSSRIGVYTRIKIHCHRVSLEDLLTDC